MEAECGHNSAVCRQMLKRARSIASATDCLRNNANAPSIRSGSSNMASEYPPISIVTPVAFDSGTAQTPGSVRLAAVAPQLGIQSALWGGVFEVKPGARTGVHHHGEQQTIAYV